MAGGSGCIQPESVSVSVSLVSSRCRTMRALTRRRSSVSAVTCGRHAGMAVAVAAHPCAETDARAYGRGIVDERGIEAGGLPGGAEAGIEAREHGGENVAQVVEDVAALVGESAAW